MKMKETQMNVSCESCREYLQILKQLQLENELLKEKNEKISKLLSSYEKNQGISLELKLGLPTSDGDLVVGESASLN
ncbi:hypothetical protein P8452_16361 [Trifolium repens]|nr:hypothetical protein P8452_16361 [Trifolium repens]